MVDEVFVDTSALYALMVAGDEAHDSVRQALQVLEGQAARLRTSSFVLQETVSLLQARSGVSAIRRFRLGLEPLLEVVWVDPSTYEAAMAALLAASSRTVSLTDWTSFEIMRRQEIDVAFTLDDDFRRQGFRVLP